MKASNKRILSIFGAVTFFIGSIMVYQILIKPIYKDIQKKRSEIATLKNVLNEEREAISQVRGVIEQYKGQKQLQDAISLTLPLDKNMPDLVTEISGLAQVSGLFTKSIFFKDLPIKKAKKALTNSLGIIEVQAKLNGSYDSLKIFLNSLETNVRIFDVQNFTVDSVFKDKVNSMDFVLTAHAYYQSQ